MLNYIKEYALAIISSTLSESIEKYLQKYNLDQYFEAVYGADVHKSKVEKIKLALAAHQTHNDNSIYITDTLGNITEATTADITSIAVSWGFHDTDTLQRGNPAYIANNVSELSECIAKFSTT